MLNIQQLNTLETDILNEFHRTYFVEANPERVKVWENFFEQMRTDALLYGGPQANAETQARYAQALRIVEFAQNLFHQQLTALLTRELPEWLQAQVQQTFPGRLGEQFGLRLTDRTTDGSFVWDEEGENQPLLDVVRSVRILEAQDAGDTVHYHGDESVEVIKNKKSGIHDVRKAKDSVKPRTKAQTRNPIARRLARGTKRSRKAE